MTTCKLRLGSLFSAPDRIDADTYSKAKAKEIE